MRSLAGLFVACFLLACTCARAHALSHWANLADPVLVGIEPSGLSHPRVDSLAQDAAGFLWIGTQSGLARFDGYRARVYTADPSNNEALPEGDIRTLLADPRGVLWIGTSSSGLVRFDESSETFHTWRPNPKAGSGPRSSNVVAMAIARDGRLWVAGDRGLDLFDSRTQRFSAVDLIAHDEIQPRVEAVHVDREGTIWIATLRGLFYRTKNASSFHRFESASGAGPETPFFSICEGSDGRLWFGSLNAVLVLDRTRHETRVIRSSESEASLAPGEQWAIVEPRPGTIWTGSNNGEVSMIDATTGSIRRIPATTVSSKGRHGGAVWQFLRDRAGFVWIGDGFGGLSFYNTRSRGIYNLALTDAALGASDQGANALTIAREGHLWVGGTLGNLLELDPRRGALRTFSTTNHLPVNGLAPGTNGAVWIGTDGGICRLSGSDVMQCPWPPLAQVRRVSTMIETPSRLWVSTGAGLFARESDGVLDAYHQGYGPRGLTSDDTFSVFRDNGGAIWIGTVNGLNRIDPVSHTVARYVHDANDDSSAGSGEIISIIQDRRGRIWAAGPGGPIDVATVRNGRVRFEHVTDENGRELQDAGALAEDAHGRIWASLSNAIALVDPVSLRARKLDLADGVSDEDYDFGAVAKSSDGTIFFGRQNGITVVSPDEFGTIPGNRTAPLVITSMRIANRELPSWAFNKSGAVIDVPADARDVSVAFAALDFAQPQSVRYSYRLSGNDRAWIEADPAYRVATYTNISPGEHTLEIRALDASSGQTLGEIALPLFVQPQWYETWWFRVLFVLLVVTAFFVAFNVATAVSRRRQRQLEELVADRTLALSRANAQLEHMSVTDSLTGLHNRRFLEQQIEADVAMSVRRYDDWNRDRSTAQPHDADLIFFLLDVDHFKTINDRYGHRSGDLVLAQMRERLCEVFRESDFVIRWGGDEFLAVARATNRDEGSDIAERICRAMHERPFALEGGVPYALAGSVGFAAFPFVTANPRAIAWRQVVDLADQALYLAKGSGRANWIGLAATAATNPVDVVERLSKSVVGPVDTNDLRMISRSSVTPI